MTIEAKLKEGPEGQGLPPSFSITGDHKSTHEVGAAVMVRGTSFVGFAEGEGGYAELTDEQLGGRTDILPNTTQSVTIFFRGKRGDTFEQATYEVKGT